MGYFDNNIHMNGAGTTYQAFLDLADAAEAKGGWRGGSNSWPASTASS